MLFACVVVVLTVAPQRADTLVVRGNTDIPPTAVRGLVPVWKTGEPLFEIGEINELAVAPDGRVYVWDWQTYGNSARTAVRSRRSVARAPVPVNTAS